MNSLLKKIQSSFLELVGSAIEILPGLIGGLIVLLLTYYIARLAEQFTSKVATRTIRSQSLQLLLARTSYIGAWVVGILTASVLAFPGLRLGDLIAALGLGSVAIGFAFQDIFKNFLAGVLLLLQEPFRINDQVIIEEYEGTVEQIDIRTTQIRTYQGERVLLPNSTVFTSAVQVRTAYGRRRTDLGVGVDYNTSLPDTAQLLKMTIAEVEGVLSEPAPEIDLVSFGDSSIDFVVRYWTLPEQKKVRQVQTRAIIAIKQAFDRADINIPYPIRTLYFYDQQQFDDYLPPSGDSGS
ncbi:MULTISPECIES: mechanosensitive ion channel family protein [unclassified Coleofasciculus]|uniref:mechanosensitive ion channel family protein n=1 Tax=unclassified Coleofasciculus TaxID=2692782 RepID=UPI0018812840|nr:MULTISPECIES: mechanosensitive ion channel family protein [unclassified Coleofasciculus]MBE9127868.1 mechanosensitive ion channel family protein [Coleofasciculus sp. LEGE 07081]MBE9149640.1 mechanosensitive ion channel family protein [Coleofasciculus sp. LEGE 07092]